MKLTKESIRLDSPHAAFSLPARLCPLPAAPDGCGGFFFCFQNPCASEYPGVSTSTGCEQRLRPVSPLQRRTSRGHFLPTSTEVVMHFVGFLQTAKSGDWTDAIGKLFCSLQGHRGQECLGVPSDDNFASCGGGGAALMYVFH